MKPLVLCCALALGGCAVGPDFQPPAAPETGSYTREALPAATVAAGGEAGAAQRFVAAPQALPQWWKQFQCEALDRLVDAALQRSPTLAQARARLVQARESYAALAGATEAPAIDGRLSAARQQPYLGAFGISNLPNPGPFTLYDASVGVSYALDFFGADRRALEALAAQVDYQSFELDAARLALAGNVVAGAVRRASLQRQIALTARVAEVQAEQLVIASQRLAAGGVSTLAVRAQRSLLAQTHAALPALATQLAQADHRLAILLGAPPSEADFAALTLDALQLPQTLPVTLPSTLARERPDIRAAQALLHQASANVGVANANLYPQFTISAAIGTQRTRIADVLGGLNIWNAGLGLTQPIFHGGALRAQQREAQAAYDAALAGWRQVVLQALQQVADVLVALQGDAQTLRSRDEAAQQAQASLATARAQYGAGGISRFALLEAQRQVAQAALDRTRAQADRLADTAALFQSLGGRAAPSISLLDSPRGCDATPCAATP